VVIRRTSAATPRRTRIAWSWRVASASQHRAAALSAKERESASRGGLCVADAGRRRPARRRRERAGCGDAARPRSAALRSLVAGTGSDRKRRSA
jgi:hypothetical protein